MRNTLIYILLSIMAVGCTNDILEVHGTGFMLALTDDAAVETRLTPSEIGAPVATQFNVKVTTNDAYASKIYDGTFTQFVTAGVGAYIIEASHGNDVELGINAPYYYGRATAEITASNPTPTVTIPCSVANSLLSVCYLDKEGKKSTSRFDEFFSDYHIAVTVGDRSANLMPANSNSAYFRSGALPKITFVGTLADNGQEVEYDIPTSSLPATLDAAQHLIVSLSLEVKPAGAILQVAKAEVQNVTVEETIPLEWLPAPKVAAFGNESSLLRYEDEDVPTNMLFTLTSAHELQEVELTIQCTDQRLSALNGTRMLSQMTSDEIKTLSELGFPLPTIGNQYNGEEFDLNNFVANLRTNDGAVTNNSIGIRIKANNRWSGETPASFEVQVKRLRFTLPSQPEGNAWSQTLYIVPIAAENVVAGEGVDVNEVMSGLYYEISTDGDNWTEVGTEVSNLVNGATYHVRARYRGTTLKSNVEKQTMETPVAVPNGDFEDLKTTLSVQDLRAGNQYKIRFIVTATYTNTASFTIQEPDGWASVNSKTCNKSAVVNDTWYMVPSTYNTTLTWNQRNDFRKTTKNNPSPYEGLSAQNGSNAMVIRNVGWDDAGGPITVPTYATPYYNTNVPNVKQRSSGKLFLGSYNYNNGTETYTEGVDFKTRPTTLNGYYKYVQDGDDSEYGTVTVSLLNGNEVIATGQQNLIAQGEYTPFAVPITYTQTVQRPTSLRIMFASSRYASYSQSEETSKVKVTTHNEEYESCMRGATLTIDNLTFTYDK